MYQHIMLKFYNLTSQIIEKSDARGFIQPTILINNLRALQPEINYRFSTQWLP